MLKKYWHIVFILYVPIYLYGFFSLEAKPYGDGIGTHIHTPIDDVIPFCKYFIIPYMLWFVYTIGAMIFFFFYSREEFIKYASFLIAGTALCLLIYRVWPTYIDLRPKELAGNDIFTWLVKFIYFTDNPANVCPSIHVLNSIAAHFAIVKSRYFTDKKILKAGSLILMILICLSTVFIKQHSVLDGLYAILLSVILYVFIYSKISLFNMFKLISAH